jgi:hypothetical protein
MKNAEKMRGKQCIKHKKIFKNSKRLFVVYKCVMI